MINSEAEQPADKQLVGAIRQNDKEAFKILYYKYFKPLFRYSWYRIRSVETSCDLVQDIFLNVWSKRRNLDPDKSIKAYLYKSLNNKIINLLKLKSSQTLSLEVKRFREKICEEKNLDTEIDITTALEQLPEKIKIVYTLSRLEGFKYSEIAEICSISVKAVEKRMTKAFGLLRKSLAEKDF